MAQLDPIVVLVPFLLVRAPRGVTIDHVAKGADKDYENEDQEDEWRHAFILYLLMCVAHIYVLHLTAMQWLSSKHYIPSACCS